LAVAIYNPPSRRVRGRIQDVDPVAVKEAMDVTAFGSFLFGQQAAKAMLMMKNDNPGAGSGTPRGTILFTGASAGVKGFAQSAAFCHGQVCPARSCGEHGARIASTKYTRGMDQNIDGGIRDFLVLSLQKTMIMMIPCSIPMKLRKHISL
jgi:hypothetical protein